MPLQCLDVSLRRHNSKLTVLKGKPDVVLPEVLKHWGATLLTFEDAFEPYAVQRDASVCALTAEMGIETQSFASHSLYDPRGIAAASKGGKPPLQYAQFTKLLSQIGEPSKPAADIPDSVPFENPIAPPAHLVFEAPGSTAAAAAASASTCEPVIPTLEQLGYATPRAASSSASSTSAMAPAALAPGASAASAPPASVLFPGGEAEALRRLDAKMRDESWVRDFSKPATPPTAVGQPSTTGLSPYLKFGCLSPR
jgi:cryptochrome